MENNFERGDFVTTTVEKGYYVVLDPDVKGLFGKGFASNRIASLQCVLSSRLKKRSIKKRIYWSTMTKINKQDIIDNIDKNIAALNKSKKILIEFQV